MLTEVTAEDAGAKVLLEVGAGAGNTAFPILARNRNPLLRIHACDYSKQAVEVMRAHEGYDEKLIQADVWDVADEESLPPGLTEGSVDVVLMIFVFSALNPREWDRAVRNLHRVLKPGGQVCFRDYARGDLAQVRFKKGRYLEENFYIRGDGTRVYFFDKDELERIWSGKKDDKEGDKDANSSKEPETSSPSFEIEALGVDSRLLVNRSRQIKMYRSWIQGKFKKK